MAETTVRSEKEPIQLIQNNNEMIESKTHDVFSPSMPLILDNPLFCIDPLLLIQISSFLDMLSVTRFSCSSLKISRFLRRNIQLQSVVQSQTDYIIEHAISQTVSGPKDGIKSINDSITSEEEIESIIPVFSELVYRFPNPFQYDHFGLLETENNIFGAFQHIRCLHLRIVPPDRAHLVSNPSSSYISKFRRHQATTTAVAEPDTNSERTESVDGDYLLLHSEKQREFASRRPITLVETSIYSRSIFAYFDHHFTSVEHLILEFDPHLFRSTFITFNIPRILGRIRRLTLKKVLDRDGSDYLSSSDLYCPECVALLQYTRNLEKLSFNFPLSSAYYPVIDGLESLKIMHRIEQPLALQHLNATTLTTASGPSAYSQNIVTLNRHRTTLISNVKMQRSLIHYFAPQMTSLHLHGSKGLQQLSLLCAGGMDGDEEALSESVQHKNKVFLGLEELCIHCSFAIYRFITRSMNAVPQLKRLQLIVGAGCAVKQCIGLLQHFESNCVLNLSYDAAKDNVFKYYFDYFVYYGLSVSNSARSLRSVWIITKKTSSAQNHELLRALCCWLECSKMTLLHIRLLVQFAGWNLDNLMECVSILADHRTVFGRDSMSYQIMMPLHREQTTYCPPSRESGSSDLQQNLLADDAVNPVDDGQCGQIDANSLKGIASHVQQRNVGSLRIDNEMAIIEKVRAERPEKYQLCHDFLSRQNAQNREQNEKDDRRVYNDKIADTVLCKDVNMQSKNGQNDRMFVTDPLKKRNESLWINHCYYCELVQ